MSYKHSIFYETQNLYDNLEEFVKDVQQKSIDSKVEQKYVENRWREPSDKTAKFVIDNIRNSQDLRFIYRFKNFDYEQEEIQVVFMFTPREWYMASYFLEPIYLDFFVGKYDLKKLGLKE